MDRAKTEKAETGLPENQPATSTPVSSVPLSIAKAGEGVHTDAEPGALQRHKFLSEQLTCALCDHALDLRHRKNRNGQRVTEEARCPQCGLRVRHRSYIIN